MLQNNEDNQTAGGMSGSLGFTAAALTVMSILSLGLVSLLCLWCKRKSKIAQVQHQVYTPRTFHHGGSKFAVTRSKTVTRPNQIAPGETCVSVSPDTTEDQSDYENIMSAQTGSVDHTYVDPLPVMPYGNQDYGKKISEEGQPGVYGNITPSSLQEDDDYENTQYLSEVAENQEKEEEPDYVNEQGAW